MIVIFTAFRGYNSGHLSLWAVERCCAEILHWGLFDMQLLASELRHQRIQDLFSKQEHLKSELMDAKSMLMIDGSTWSYDCE